MLFAVLSGFILALVAPVFAGAFRGRAGWLLATLPAALFGYFASFLPLVAGGGTAVLGIDWIPALGIRLSFFVDGLSLLFALLISGIGTFILIYAGGYLDGHPQQGRFFSFLLMFMASMLGLVLADNVVTLFVFWELTSITSFLLIGFDHARAASRRAALQALVVTGGGGLALLAGLLLMGQIAGTYEMSEILSSGDVLRDSPAYVAIFVLVAIGAFTKSAQVPFHFWLPNAMEAPTPVSAYLHSATMVKAGVYLLARVNPALGDTALWSTVLPLVGGATFVLGAVLALRNTDLKLMLAQTTVASLGLLVMLIGIGSDRALEAAVLYLLAHSLFKGCLFMVAGCVDHETGTREQPDLGGLRPLMPLTALAAGLAALSMSGLPPFFGFIAKEVIYKATPYGELGLLLTGAAVLANALMLAVAALVAVSPFFGALKPTPKTPHEGPASLVAGPLVLAALGLGFGVFNGWPGHNLVQPAVSALAGEARAVELHLWTGVNLALVLSIATVALGIALYLAASPIRRVLIPLHTRTWGPDTGYDQFMDALVAAARGATRITQTGRMSDYLLMTMVALAAVLVVPLVEAGGIAPPMFGEVGWFQWGVFALAVVGAAQVTVARRPLFAVVSMGILGLAVALIFLMFGAPDLAFTQLMAETLSVVILTLVIARLPMDNLYARAPARVVLDATVAIAVGASMAMLLMAVTAGPLDLTLSEYFAARSYPEAYGRNIVNVILVDFRALDTLGEILVVVIAGVAAIGLIASGARQPLATPTGQPHRARARRRAA